MVEVVLADAEQAFRPLSPVRFNIDRLETNPRFAAITRPANAAILVRLRIDMEDRGGTIELLLPYATIEPIRDVLLQMFMGEKFGRDPIWEGHLATEIGQADIAVEAVLYEAELPLKQLMQLEVGHTLTLDLKPDALVTVRCGEVTLTEGRMGRVGDRVAVRVVKPLRKPKTTSPCSRWRTRPRTAWRLREQRIWQRLRTDDREPGRGSAPAHDRLLRRAQQPPEEAQGRRAGAEGDDRRTDHRDRDRRARDRRLKMTVRDCDQSLGERLRAGESLARELGGQLDGGRQILAQLAQITLAARGPQEPPAPQLPDAQATAQAASAFAARARQRLQQAA
jgi:hypothetical protein